jgi:hypothetical protein
MLFKFTGAPTARSARVLPPAPAGVGGKEKQVAVHHMKKIKKIKIK